MLLHYGFAHVQPIVLAGISLLTFAAGLLIGSWSRTESGEAGTASPSSDAEQ